MPKPKKNLPCPHAGCGKMYTCQAKLQDHLDSHAGIKRHKCPQCPAAYRRADQLRSHVGIAHQKVEKQYGCPDCDMKFHYLQHRDTHVKTQHVAGKKDVSCTFDGCEQVCNGKDALLSHVQQDHQLPQAKYVLACGINGCKHTSPYMSYLVTHRQGVHVPKPAKTYVCANDECRHLTFTTQVELTHHRDTAHEHACSVCAKQFKSREIMQAHFRMKHIGRSGHQCPQCPRQLTTAYNLKVHIEMVHADSACFCEVCYSKLKNRQSLLKHQRTHVCTGPAITVGQMVGR